MDTAFFDPSYEPSLRPRRKTLIPRRDNCSTWNRSNRTGYRGCGLDPVTIVPRGTGSIGHADTKLHDNGKMYLMYAPNPRLQDCDGARIGQGIFHRINSSNPTRIHSAERLEAFFLRTEGNTKTPSKQDPYRLTSHRPMGHDGFATKNSSRFLLFPDSPSLRPIKEKRKRKHETEPSRIDDKPNPRIEQMLGKHPNRFRERKSLHLD